MRVLLLPLLALSACANMYRGPSEHLHTPKPVPVPITAIDKPAPIPYVDTCVASFHDSAKGLRRDPKLAEQRVTVGAAKVSAAVKEPAAAKKQVLFTDGIQQYRAALMVDPYDADATLQLALAYDKVWRRGCALKLLDRLAVLSQHPTLGTRAKQLAQDVQSNTGWFVDYRSAATDAALGVRTP